MVSNSTQPQFIDPFRRALSGSLRQNALFIRLKYAAGNKMMTFAPDKPEWCGMKAAASN
jgi:hypothetical protein